MSKNHEPDFFITEPSDEITDNALASFNLGAQPDSRETPSDNLDLPIEFGRLALLTLESESMTGIGADVVDDSDTEAVSDEISEQARLRLKGIADSLRKIIDESGHKDTHSGVFRVLDQLKSSRDMPEAIRNEAVSYFDELLYEHSNTISRNKIISDLEKVANKIESIASN